MNVVCVTGRLTRSLPPPYVPERREDWTRLVLEAPRQTPFGDDEPGVIQVVLALPPELGKDSRAALRPGRAVAVVGMLDVDVDRSGDKPRPYHSVIAQRVELVAEPFEARFDVAS